MYNGGTGTSNAASGIAEFSGSSAAGVVDALSLVNSATAALGNATQLNFHNAGNYSPTGSIRVTQAGDTTTDSKMEFKVYTGSLYTAMTIDHDGQVGIGSAPAQQLTVTTPSSYEGILINGPAAPNVCFDRYSGTTPEWKVGISGNNGDNFGISTGTANVDRLVIDSSGNVSIGSYTPSDGKLLVYAGNSGATAYQNGNSGITIENSGRAALNLLTPNTQDSYVFFGDPEAGNAGYIGYEHSTDNLVIKSTDYIYLNGDRVGVGTANPQQKLHVEGNIYLGPNNTPNIIHSGSPFTLSSDGDVYVVSDSNDTSGVANGGSIHFGGGSLTNTDSNQDFNVNEYSGGSVAYSPRLTYGKFNGATGNLELTDSLDAGGYVATEEHFVADAWDVNSNYSTVKFQDDLIQLTKTGSSYIHAQYGTKVYTDVEISVEFKTTNSTHFGIFFHGQATNPQDNSYNVIVRGLGSNDDVRVQERNASNQTYLLPTAGQSTGTVTGLAHNEGNYFCTNEQLKEIQDNNQIAIYYCDNKGQTADQFNPNGSLKNIAGIFNKEKNVLGMMPHPERMIDMSLSGEDGSLFFKNLINNIK